MKQIIIIILLTFCVSNVFAQQYTPMTAAGYQMKRLKVDSTLHIPSFCGIPTTRNSTAKEGAIAIDTCNNLLYIWTNANGWNIVTGSGGSIGYNGLSGTDSISLGGTLTKDVLIYGKHNFNIYGQKTIDINAFGRGEIYLDSEIVYIGAKYLYLDTDSTTTSTADTSSFKPLGYNANHVVRSMTSWPKTDTTSLSNRINLKVNISDTATMLSKYLRKTDTSAMLLPYLRKIDTTAMLSKYLRKIDTASLSNRINLKLNIADTTAMLSKYLRKIDTTNRFVNNVTKKNDSTITVFKGSTATDILLPRGSSGSGTVTSVATGYGLTGGPITSTGTLIVDSATLSGKYLRKSDTTAMLLPYLRKIDTAAMLLPYLRKIDTTAMLLPYLRKIDTTAMLLPYLRKVDTTAMLSKYLRRNDTTAMLSPYLRKIDTTNKFVNDVTKINDSTIRVFKGSTSNDLLIRGNASNGGSGTVTSISQGYGITNSPNPIIATGTITVDTATLSGKYIRITDTANMLSPYPIGSGAATTVAFWNGTRSLTNNSQIAIDNSSPTSPALQIRASTGTTRSFMNPTYSGVQYNATNYAINNISTTTPSFINHEEIINRESRLYSNSLQFSNLSTSGYVTLSPPTSFNNRNYTLPDSSGTIALNEYTVNSISRTPGKDSIIFYVGSTRYAIKDSVGTNPAPVGYYGAFQDNTIQTAAAINTPYAMKFGTTDLSNAVTMVSDGSNLTRITIANTGIYNIQFSAQFDRTNSGTDVVDIWLRKNGTDVVGSGGKIVLAGGAAASAIIATWNYVLDVAAGDYYQLMWSTPDTHIRLLYEAAQSTPFAHPIIPSIILTVTQQSGIMAGTGITAINSLTGAAQTMVTGTDSTDFKIVSNGTSHTFNLPTASATKRGALSSTDWSTFNSKIGAADTSVFQRKNIAAYSLQANNTASAANVTTQTYRDVAEAAISGTIAWVGTTAPSSLTSANYSWSQIGKTVTVEVNLLYANASAAITAFSFPLPSDMPTPVTPTGWSAASNYLFTSICTVHATTPAITSTSYYGFIRRDAANTGYELGATGSAATARGWKFTLTYKAQ